ncbi:MAG: hypothetical protein K0Q55_561, partial [Verrucomicrobia bacterium]|nr:hypothetical protein [Verrucomicrobiota bacterium]
MHFAGHSWPHLEYPKAVNWLRAVVFLSTMIACIAAGGYFHLFAGCLMFFLSFPIAIRVDDWLTGKFEHRRVILPEKLVTIANLIDAVVPQEWTKAQGMISEWDRERVAKKMKEIVIDQLCTGEEQYHEDARFIEDFGGGEKPGGDFSPPIPALSSSRSTAAGYLSTCSCDAGEILNRRSGFKS